jgi:hypothetical protein
MDDEDRPLPAAGPDVTAQKRVRGVFALMRSGHGEKAGRLVHHDDVPVFVHDLEPSLQYGREAAPYFQNVTRLNGMAGDAADFAVEVHPALLQHLSQRPAGRSWHRDSEGFENDGLGGG